MPSRHNYSSACFLQGDREEDQGAGIKSKGHPEGGGQALVSVLVGPVLISIFPLYTPTRHFPYHPLAAE